MVRRWRSGGDFTARGVSTAENFNAMTSFFLKCTVVHWRKHLLKVPSGKAGKNFVAE